MKLDTMTKCISCKNISAMLYIKFYNTPLCDPYKYTYIYVFTHSHTYFNTVAMERDFFSLVKNIEFKEERTRDGSKCLSFFILYLFSIELST